MRAEKRNHTANKTGKPVRIVAAIVLMMITAFPIFTFGQAVSLPVLPTNLFGFACLVVLTVIAAAVIVFMLAGIIDSPNARGWARFQVYEGVLTLILIMIFLVFLYLFTLDPSQALSSVNLLPNGGEFPCGNAHDVFAISTCDIATFNRYAFGLFEATFFVTMILVYSPGIGVNVGINVPPKVGAGAITGDTSFTIGSQIGSFFPLPLESSLGFVFTGILGLELLNQVQVLILSGSLLWLGFFVTLGLIVRSFGFMRTFGGAMIALGLGLGLIYPLVTAITYGFIDTTLVPYTIPALGSDILLTFLVNVPAVLFGGQINVPTGPWVFALGTTVSGLTFMGFLNFTIVDAFIVDFSRSIGERIDFMSLLVGLI